MDKRIVIIWDGVDFFNLSIYNRNHYYKQYSYMI
nr:MAG TPA: hypothetical protein [Caudoviricetes sp.]